MVDLTGQSRRLIFDKGEHNYISHIILLWSLSWTVVCR